MGEEKVIIIDDLSSLSDLLYHSLTIKHSQPINKLHPPVKKEKNKYTPHYGNKAAARNLRRMKGA